MRQRGGSWQLIVHAGRDPVTGKKRYVSRTVKGTKREAQRALAALVTQTGHGVPADTATTVSQLLDAWFAQARTDFSPSTVRETNGIIERYLKPAWERPVSTGCGSLRSTGTTAGFSTGQPTRGGRWVRPRSAGSTASCGGLSAKRCGGGGSPTTTPLTPRRQGARARGPAADAR